ISTVFDHISNNYAISVINRILDPSSEPDTTSAEKKAPDKVFVLRLNIRGRTFFQLISDKSHFVSTIPQRNMSLVGSKTPFLFSCSLMLCTKFHVKT
ncbi:hypothetical protein HHI36_010231, partial [Cryptolaemus montrouzieri]